MSALPNEVANMEKACAVDAISVLASIEPAHTEEISLAGHVKSLQVVQFCLHQDSCLVCIQWY